MASSVARILKLQPEPGVRLVYRPREVFQRPVARAHDGLPELRYMGLKHRIFLWIHALLRGLPFEADLRQIKAEHGL
jgi:hypothetical protein